MKIENMRKKIREIGREGDFIYKCITNDDQLDCPGSAAVYEEHWRAASSFNGFLKAVQMDERLMYTSQAYGEIGRLYRWPIKVKPGCLIDGFIVGSDAGSVKLGDVAGTCGFMVLNGYGDGCHGVTIVKEYKVVGKLMLKDTGEPLLDADGKPVTAEATFTPDHDHGTVDVTFTFDASLLAGQQVVAFETLYRLDKEITAHADIEDEDQTIGVIQPGIDTVAVDGFDGDKDVVADPEAKITDTLSYKNVIPGSTYEVHGIVMDAETGLPLLSGEGADKVGEDDLTDFWHELCDLTGVTSAKPLDGGFDLFASIGGIFGQSDEGDDGEEVWFPQVEPDWDGIEALLEDNPEIADHLSTATETFEADKDHGEIKMDFGLDASDLAGKKAVVFELLVKDGIAVGAHSDLTDEDQTVTIVPSTIGTEATDKTDGDHEVMVSKEVTIVDAVHYENLLPGKEYTVKGVLMDKSTDKPLMVGDKKVEASGTFGVLYVLSFDESPGALIFCTDTKSALRLYPSGAFVSRTTIVPRGKMVKPLC